MAKAGVPMARKGNGASVPRRLHRFIGVIAALYVIFMVFSGLAINHSNRLGLDQGHVSQAFLLDWYGLKAPEHIQSFAVGDDWVSFAGSQLYLNDMVVSTVIHGKGAVSGNGMIIAAGIDELILLDHDGKLIERIAWAAQGPEPVESIGLQADGSVTVKAAGQLWLADAELLNWRQAEASSNIPFWSETTAPPDSLRQSIEQQYRGGELSPLQLLLDFHSGRIFGTAGVVVYDFLALAVGFLAISGLFLWARGRRNGKRKG
jgi:hypothetical protein